MPFFGKTKTLIPKIKETHHATEQLTIPTLLQLEVDVLGTAAEDMKLIEEVMRAPFAYLRLHITLVDSHFLRRRVSQFLQIGTYVLLARDKTRVDNVGVGRSGCGVGRIHCSMSALPFDKLRAQGP